MSTPMNDPASVSNETVSPNTPSPIVPPAGDTSLLTASPDADTSNFVSNETHVYSILLISSRAADPGHIQTLLSAATPAGMQPMRLLWSDTLEGGLGRMRVEPVDLVLANADSADVGAATIDGILDGDPYVPIILLTDADSEAATSAALGRGAQDTLARSELTAPLLRRTVRRAIERAVASAIPQHPAVASAAKESSTALTATPVVEEAQIEARQAQKMEAIARLAGGVAHDFNNIMTVVNGYSALMLGRMPPTEPMRRHVELIKAAGDRAAGLTRHLLAFSRRAVMQPRVIDLNALLVEQEEPIRAVLGDGIELRMTRSPLLARVLADPEMIGQILIQLASNARDAMPSGGHLIVETQTVDLAPGYARRHGLAAPGRFVRMTVADTGCGMGREILEHVFEPFFTTKGKGKGTGLGLSTVYGIIRQSGGNVTVQSELGLGTTFKVYLPAVRDPLSPASSSTLNAVSGRPHETILLVDDDPAVRGLCQDLLAGWGYRLLTANSGDDALAVSDAFKGRIHLMLSDVVMPGMNGGELAERIVARRPEIKVLFMSGYAENAIVHKGILPEGTFLIQKPFRADALSAKLREQLDALKP